jgi:hypothetical protein
MSEHGLGRAWRLLVERTRLLFAPRAQVTRVNLWHDQKPPSSRLTCERIAWAGHSQRQRSGRPRY